MLLSVSTGTTLHHHHHDANTTTTAAFVASSATTAPATASPAATTSNLMGDVNGDGTVNILDFNILEANYGKTSGATWAMGDFNGDGKVDFADFTLLTQNWGASAAPTSGSITPIQNTAPSNIGWSGPITINSGGTYTGNWQSLNAGTPAVQINTTQPVVILNSNIQSKGDLIYSGVHGNNVTVKNTHGWGLNPNVYGQAPGRFVNDSYFANIDVENNTLVSTAGIYMAYYQGNGTSSQTVKVLKNVAQNIDGRWSDGNGGFLTGADQNDYVQFAQFNANHNMVGAEIGWNEVINLPWQSRVEDNISIYRSSGTSASPILIHDNYIQGAYAADPANDSSYTGGGIMLADGADGTTANECAYTSAYNNIIVGTSEYGMAISTGHDNAIYNNTIISSALLSNGQKIAAENVGIYIWNNMGDTMWGNNREYGNTLGWMGPSGRNDTWTPNAASSSGLTPDTFLSGNITLAQEQSYYSVWARKVGSSGHVIGAS